MVELRAQDKANPNKRLALGPPSIMGELFKDGAGVEIGNGSYRVAGIINDLLGGHIEKGFVSLPSAMRHYSRTILGGSKQAAGTPLAAEMPL